MSEDRKTTSGDGRLPSRLFWFVTLWAGGVAVVGGLALVIKLLLQPA